MSNVAFERGLYSHAAADKKPPLQTESDLASLEGFYSSVWPDIIDRAATSDTRRNLARFIALMVLRHPTSRQRIRRVNMALRESIVDMGPDETVEFIAQGGSVSISVDKVMKGIADDRYVTQTSFLILMRRLVADLSEVLFKRRWGVVFSSEPAFLTSDCPVVLCRGTCEKRTYGYGTPGTRVLIPFSPTRLLVIDDSWPHEFGHYKLADSNIFNELLVTGAIRFMYSFRQDASLPAKIRNWKAS